MRYTETHEWLEQKNDTWVCGITDHGQQMLSDIVFVELPKPGASFAKADVVGVLESVKAAADIYMPVSGTIVDVNDALNTTPELINEKPHDAGWLFEIKIDDLSQIDALMDESTYKNHINT